MPLGDRELLGHILWEVVTRDLPPLKERVVFLGTAIDAQVGNLVVAQMLYLEREDPDADIRLYVNSPGGSVHDGLAIYDTIQHLRCDVQTICLGMAASAASFLLADGTKGKHYCLPHSTVLLHQPWVQGGGQTQAVDLEIQAREILPARRGALAVPAGARG